MNEFALICGCRCEGGMMIVKRERAQDALRDCWTANVEFVGSREACEAEMQRLDAVLAD